MVQKLNELFKCKTKQRQSAVVFAPRGQWLSDKGALRKICNESGMVQMFRVT